MTQYLAKIAFWLRAYDCVAVEAENLADAIELAKAAATAVMRRTCHPEHIDLDERREGVIAFIGRKTQRGIEEVASHIEFDDDRIPHRPGGAADLAAPLTQDRFDILVDDATHAVGSLIPSNVIAALSADAHMTLLYAINDALTPILADYVEHGD